MVPVGNATPKKGHKQMSVRVTTYVQYVYLCDTCHAIDGVSNILHRSTRTIIRPIVCPMGDTDPDSIVVACGRTVDIIPIGL